MITCNILTEDGIAVIHPTGPLTAEDFAQVAAAVDAYLSTHSALNGLLIQAREFPGWEDFQGFIHHVRFIRDHHRSIRKVALVSDSKLASLAPHLAQHFVSADVRSFEDQAVEEALAWLKSD